MVSKRICHSEIILFLSSLEGLPIGVIVSDYPKEDLSQPKDDDDTEEYFSADEDVIDLSLVKSELNSSNLKKLEVETQTDQDLTDSEICHIL